MITLVLNACHAALISLSPLHHRALKFVGLLKIIYTQALSRSILTKHCSLPPYQLVYLETGAQANGGSENGCKSRQP